MKPYKKVKNKLNPKRSYIINIKGKKTYLKLYSEIPDLK